MSGQFSFDLPSRTLAQGTLDLRDITDCVLDGSLDYELAHPIFDTSPRTITCERWPVMSAFESVVRIGSTLIQCPPAWEIPFVPEGPAELLVDIKSVDKMASSFIKTNIKIALCVPFPMFFIAPCAVRGTFRHVHFSLVRPLRYRHKYQVKSMEIGLTYIPSYIGT
jgi:hypothetical protein